MESKKPTILITNDDGIHAPGIKQLWNALREMANLIVVAPAAEQSAAGLSISIRTPLRVEKVDHFASTAAWSVSGTPADCVKMAFSVLLKNPPDLVLAGINRGSNAGRNLLYSGTVAGVIEGLMHDIPGIAFSCYDYENPNYSLAAQHVPAIVNHVLQHPMSVGTFLNVNFPPLAQRYEGIKLTRQGKEFWAENPDKRLHPAEGKDYYWLGAKLAEYDEHEDSDITWLRKGFVTAVPVHVGELTDHEHLKTRKHVFEKLF